MDTLGDILHAYFSCMLDICIAIYTLLRLNWEGVFKHKTECQTKLLGLIYFFELLAILTMVLHMSSYTVLSVECRPET